MHATIAGPLRLAAALGLLLMLLAGAAGPSARAQDDPTEPAAPTETSVAALEGALAILTATCTVETEPPAPVAILTEAQLAEQAACGEGVPALVAIDGGDPFEATSGTQVALPVGLHTLAEVGSGASAEVEIVEATTSTLVVVGFEVVLPPTEVPTEEPTAEPSETPTSEAEVEAAAVAGSVTLVTHLCWQGIATTAELEALDSWGRQLVACPVVVLPDDIDQTTAGAVTANDADAPLTYGQTVAFDDGESVTRTLADADLAQAVLCESDLGANLNGDDDDDRCYDQSGYAFVEIPGGAVTVASTDAPGDAPEEYTFLTGKADPSSGDTLGDIDESAGTIALDTAGDEAVTVHLFFAPVPLENRVTIVGHLCPAAIESRDDFNAQGDLHAKLVGCPSITLPGDAAPAEGEAAGEREFAVSIQGSDAAVQVIAALPFAPRTICERDLPTSINGDPSDDLCLDASGYVADGVAQGEIRVRATSAPAGALFVATEIEPDPDDDDATITTAGSKGLTVLDTTGDGNLTLHVFFRPEIVATPTRAATRVATATATSAVRTPTRAPTRTATPVPGQPTATRTPSPTPSPTTTGTPDDATETATATRTATPTGGGGGTGTVQVYKFVCTGADSQSRFTTLAPGASAGPGDLGDATCQNANSQTAKLVLAGGRDFWNGEIPSIGILTLTDVPVTTGSQQHTFDDTRWALSGRFKIEAGKTTRLISLTYEPDPTEQIDLPPEFPDFPDFGAEPPPIPPSSSGGEFPFPDDEEGDFGPDPVDEPLDDPFGNTDDEMSQDEADAEAAAQAELAKVDEGEDLPTVGTRRATTGTMPLWLTIAGLGMVGMGLATRRSRRATAR